MRLTISYTDTCFVINILIFLASFVCYSTAVIGAIVSAATSGRNNHGGGNGHGGYRSTKTKTIIIKGNLSTFK